MDLEAAADRRVGTYSGGMRRRLDLALALVHAPEVLFLDEPTTGLDPISRLTLWEEVRRLNAESGTTVFLTTQYLEEADQLAGRVAIIDGGRIVAEGTPRRAEGAGRRPDPHASRWRDPDQARAAEAALRPLGELLPARAGAVALRLQGGRVGACRRWCGRSTRPASRSRGWTSPMPTLDDVFVAKTGRRLEAEGPRSTPAAAAPAPGVTLALAPDGGARRAGRSWTPCGRRRPCSRACSSRSILMAIFTGSFGNAPGTLPGFPASPASSTSRWPARCCRAS